MQSYSACQNMMKWFEALPCAIRIKIIDISDNCKTKQEILNPISWTSSGDSLGKGKKANFRNLVLQQKGQCWLSQWPENRSVRSYQVQSLTVKKLNAPGQQVSYHSLPHSLLLCDLFLLTEPWPPEKSPETGSGSLLGIIRVQTPYHASYLGLLRACSDLPLTSSPNQSRSWDPGDGGPEQRSEINLEELFLFWGVHD